VCVQYDAEEDLYEPPPLPRAAQVKWSLASIQAHQAYPTFLQYTRDENRDQQWEISEAEEDIEGWVEWLTENEEAAMEEQEAAAADAAAEQVRAADGAEAAIHAPAMDVDAPRGLTRPQAMEVDEPGEQAAGAGLAD
jgi:glycine/D-amino acid oxidase-like deaminating enzyme